MKKLLLGTTTLVAAGLLAGGIASAEDKKPAPIQLSIGGYWFGFLVGVSQDTGVGEPGNNIRPYGISQKGMLRFKGSTTLDNGLQAGVRVEFRTETCGDQVDESWMWFDSQYGRVELGSTTSAPNKMWYGAPTPILGQAINSPGFVYIRTGANSIGPTGLGSPTTYITYGLDKSEKVTYFTPRVVGFQFGASYTPDRCKENVAVNGGLACGGSFSGLPASNNVGQQSEIWELGLNYTNKFGDFDVGAFGGYAHSHIEANPAGNLKDEQEFALGASVTYNAINVGGGYRYDNLGNKFAPGGATPTTGTKQQDWNIGALYTIGDWSFGATYHHTSTQIKNAAGVGVGHDTLNGVVAGGTYVLGPGINLTGGVQYWDLSAFNGAPANENTAWVYLIGTKLEF